MTSIHDNPRSTRPADARLGRGLRGRWSAAGMTLVEMLVAISVLAVMILSVSTILVQTQRFISAAQENRRSHAMAFTIARIIRRDLRRVSKDGFLCVTSGAGGSMLIFSTAGPVTGINESTKGDGSIVCYGQQSTSSGTKYLWRPEYICNCTTGTASPDISGERINVNFSILRQCAASSGDANSPPFTLQALADKVASTTPGNMQLPPATATQLKNLWQVLVTNIDKFQVSWTDGTKGTDGNLKWQTTSLLCTHKNQTDWTSQNITGWPKAIRITFAIKDPSMPKELRGTGQYEVICIVGA